MIFAFWISFAIVFYTYIGYGIILYCLVLLRRIVAGRRILPSVSTNLPSCTLVIAAYNEEDFIRQKIINTLALDYPEERLKILFITDGSTDRTPEILAEYTEIKLMHQAERKGKVDALHRAVEEVDTEIMIFTDANTTLNQQALLHIAKHYSDNRIGAVAGEKRIQTEEIADAGSAGEGFYWKYESTLKKWDSELYSVVGAAGELFSVRTALYTAVPGDTILDDFMISMRIAEKGYRIVYEPDAFASETASENVTEELKRKIRIAAGGIQSILRLLPLLNIFRYGILSFQYISHRVLRWTITPFLLIMMFFLNGFIVICTEGSFYAMLFGAQILFYLLACLGFIFEKRQVRIKAFFIPYYFCVMNYAILAGLVRYFRKRQSAAWERAGRKFDNK